MRILIKTQKKIPNKLMWLAHVVASENLDGSYDILKNRFEATPKRFETANDLNNYLQELITIKD